MEWLKKNRISFELTTVSIFILVLLSNLMVIQYADGYFGYYGISLGEVNFVPQMYDYVRVALPALIATAIITAGLYGMLRLSDYLGEWLAEKILPEKLSLIASRFIKKNGKVFSLIESTFSTLLRLIGIGLLLYVIWVMATEITPKMGSKGAEFANEYSSISKPKDILQDVIIYKNGNEIVLKTYNTNNDSFQEGYKVLVSTSYDVHAISRNMYQ